MSAEKRKVLDRDELNKAMHVVHLKYCSSRLFRIPSEN